MRIPLRPGATEGMSTPPHIVRPRHTGAGAWVATTYDTRRGNPKRRTDRHDVRLAHAVPYWTKVS
ncbi:hypothetical protein FRAAL1506 [Frankia alni ACN14a]|uniref:Uncharacterized protein n=1 Tax=Frankia alni (strain DSM 45986 / CECT 9034 / ACN14a) TaxID=326424 RepID=Q0RQL2_FRAAA|nr:hypothetical protein FRAAL1506 [Frankia alni ACN14a]